MPEGAGSLVASVSTAIAKGGASCSREGTKSEVSPHRSQIEACSDEPAGPES